MLAVTPFFSADVAKFVRHNYHVTHVTVGNVAVENFMACLLELQKCTCAMQFHIVRVGEKDFDLTGVLPKTPDVLFESNTVLDLGTGTLLCDGKSVRLSAKEFDVMRLLMQGKERNLSKEVILARVWGYDSNAVENHVEVYVGFLRKKLARIGSNIRIEAIRRLGYHLEVDKL